MKAKNGPAITYELVYCFRAKPIHRRGADGYFRKIGRRRGILVKSVGSGNTWYHLPEDYLSWKHSEAIL